MPHERLIPEFTFSAERLEQLSAVVPEAFADGKINWETLREALAEYYEPEVASAEHFGLFWPGKREARRLAALPSRGTLVPALGQGVDEDRTKNLFIEGDNLEVLKLLQKAYAGRVKMIYIDPPYNTGNDFVYNDDFADLLGEYLRKSGQADEQGVATTNTRADGRFHSNWLSMLYPRLKLARNFLAEDGLLFVSIDDNEVFHLRMLLNELFGEENFLETFVWKKSYGGGAKEKYVVRQHEYILCYARDRGSLPSLWLPANQRVTERYYKFRDDKYELRGPYRLQPLEAAKSMDPRPNLVYTITMPDGSMVKPKRQWLWKRERAIAALAADELVFTKADGGHTVSYKQYLKDEEGDERGSKPTSILDGPYTQQGTKDLSSLFGGDIPLQFPKPVGLLKTLIQLGTDPESGHLVLDFFAGSATTAQAVLELNREDGGNRHAILVELPGNFSEIEGTCIASIGKERIRRAIKKLRKEAKPKPSEDLGVRVLRLAESHYRAWEDYAGGDLEQLQILFDEAENPLIKGWTPEALLVEVMLLGGFPLDSTVAEQVGVRGNTVLMATSGHSTNRLLVCFDKQVKDSIVDELTFEPQDVLVCLDSALTDQAKQRLADRCTLKTI